MFITPSFYEENFTGAANTLLGAINVDPSGQGWRIHNASLPFSHGGGYAVAAGNGAEASVDVLSADQQFDIQFAPGGLNEHIILLRSDATGANCYRIIAKTSSNEFVITRVINGVSTQLRRMTFVLGTTNTHRTVGRIYSKGASTIIEVYEKETFVGFYEDASALQIRNNTRVGMRHGNYVTPGGRFSVMRGYGFTRVQRVLI